MVVHSEDTEQTMSAANELRSGLLALAKRSMSIMSACSNLESTKLYLVLPFVGLLGYDYADPFEVFPDHIADLDPTSQTQADFAVLFNGNPAIAIVCRPSPADLQPGLADLARYFDILPEVKLGVLTNGVRFSFYVDAVRPDKMDDEPFLTIDLEQIARAGVQDEIVETLIAATKAEFEPEKIAETAHVALVKRRLRSVFVEEAQGPSEAFSRFALERIGLSSPAKAVLDRYYTPLVKAAFDESLLALGLDRVRSTMASDGRSRQPGGRRIGGAERELALLNYIRKRLAYLAPDEAHYSAIDAIGSKQYLGRLSVFLDREAKGKLFDCIQGIDGRDTFVFAPPIGELSVTDLRELDMPLKAVFEARVEELGFVSRGETTAIARRA